MAAGTSEGINFIQDDNIIGSITEEDGLANPQILCLVEGDDGTLYAGSDGAGIYAIRDRKIRENYSTHDGLTSDVILRMTAYKDGFVVVASNSLCYMSNGKIKALEHFPYFNNYDVRILGENAYVLSSSGIYMTDAEGLVSGKNFSYKLFNSSDGLLGGLTANSWNYIDENGVLYFCCNNGVLNFTPEEKAQRADYKFGIAYITGDGESIVPEGNTYVVPAEAKLIMIKASLRNYSLNNVKLKFYIEGLDDNPKVVAQSELESIQISNLPHGNYKIHIQIMSDDENTVVQEQVYTLVKEPQLWENWWYRVYLVIVVIWIVAFITWGILILINMSKRKKQLEELRKELEETVSIQTEEIRQQAERRVNFQWHVIDSMASLIESRDGNTGEHVINTRNYVALLSSELLKRGMYPDIITEEYVDALARVAPLHDVGKIKISDVILNKPGKFTSEEFEVMKEHTLFGDKVIGDILVDAEPEMLKVAKEVALCHHERWDGTGYPMGKKGEEIPLSARIMAIADVFDALVSKRVYKEAFAIEQAFEIIKESAGTHLDAGLVDVFLRIKLKTESEAYDSTEEAEDNDHYDYQLTTPEQCIMQLEFYMEAYKKQKEGADFRLYNIRLKKNVWIATVAALILFCAWLISLSFKFVIGFGLYPLIAFFMSLAVLFKCIQIMIDSIYSYGVHFEIPRFERYIEKYKIFTLQDEKNLCDVEIMKLKKMIEEVKLKAAETPKIERKYFEYKYDSKYADIKVCHFFEEHSKVTFVVEIVFILLIFTFAVSALVNSSGGLSGGFIGF